MQYRKVIKGNMLPNLHENPLKAAKKSSTI